MSISTEKLFRQDAVSSYPDGWTCIECGDEYSENTVDVKDYYVINTDEGTLCSPCHELDNATLECRECGSLLIGDEPRIITTCDECKTKTIGR